MSCLSLRSRALLHGTTGGVGEGKLIVNRSDYDRGRRKASSVSRLRRRRGDRGEDDEQPQAKHRILKLHCEIFKMCKSESLVNREYLSCLFDFFSLSLSLKPSPLDRVFDGQRFHLHILVPGQADDLLCCIFKHYSSSSLSHQEYFFLS